MNINNKKQQETINCLKQEMIDLKEEINKNQQETINSLKQEMIDLNEQTEINNSTINDEEPLDEQLLMISNIWNDSAMNNKNYLIRDILDKSIINDIMDD